VVVSVLIVFHLSALLAAALAPPPPHVSPLERGVADLFAAYYELVDQGYTYRYYAPEPPPTPVVTATLHFADGRPDESVRLPDRKAWPRLRYQRQLALAFHLFADFQEARRETGQGSRSRWARSYAKHLCRQRPGCTEVTLFAQLHLIPDLQRTHEALESGGPSAHVDLDAEEYYTIPERIGDFPCGDF
jgi:hypothetical protein